MPSMAASVWPGLTCPAPGSLLPQLVLNMLNAVPPHPLFAVTGTTKGDAPYQVRVQQATAGVLHDHLALFKVRGGRQQGAGQPLATRL